MDSQTFHISVLPSDFCKRSSNAHSPGLGFTQTLLAAGKWTPWALWYGARECLLEYFEPNGRMRVFRAAYKNTHVAWFVPWFLGSA